MEGGSRVVRWQDEVKMENLDQFVMETAPQVSPLMTTMMVMMEFGWLGGGGQEVKMKNIDQFFVMEKAAHCKCFKCDFSMALLDRVHGDKSNFKVGKRTCVVRRQ